MIDQSNPLNSVEVKTHQPCPCGKSSDAFALYADGHGRCFSCSKTFPKVEQSVIQGQSQPKPKERRPLPPLPDKYQGLPDRGINEKTAEKYRVGAFPEGDTFLHSYPYTAKGKHVASKLRRRTSERKNRFTWAGQYPKVSELELFGQSVFPAGSAPAITIVEGECDAMAAFQMNGGFPVVSVQGASSAVRDVKNNLEYLSSFDEVVVCMDQDEPGQKAALDIANALPVGKVRILNLQEHKDPNDYLRANKARAFTREWFNAAKYTPATLKTGKQLWDEVINPPDYETIPYPFEGLNSKTYGLRLSEMVIVNAQHKVGKSTFLGELTHHILKTTDYGVGLMRLEESNRDSALNLMSIEANKRLHLPDVWEDCSEEEIRAYFDATVNTDKVVIWDHFGSNSIDAVLAQIRNMEALGCKYIILDHLSIIVSDQSGDERKQLDELATKLKTLCMEINICVLAIVHQNREGKIRGTAGIEQLANIVLRLERDKEHSSDFVRNTMTCIVAENRFCGETGHGCHMYFSQETGRLMEMSPEEFIEGQVDSSFLEGWSVEVPETEDL